MDSFAFMTLDESEITQFERVAWKSNPSSISHLPLQELITMIDRFGLSRRENYDDIKLNIESHFTIVPAPLFDSSQWWIYLQRLHPHLNRDDICFLQRGEMVLIYAFPLGLRRVLSTMLPECRVLPFVVSVARFFDRNLGRSAATIQGLLTHGQLYLSVQDRGETKLLNRYAATSASDVIYYTMMVAEQLEIEPSKSNLQLAGSKAVLKEVHSVFDTYFLSFKSTEWINGWRLPVTVIDPIDIIDLYCVQHANNRR